MKKDMKVRCEGGLWPCCTWSLRVGSQALPGSGLRGGEQLKSFIEHIVRDYHDVMELMGFDCKILVDDAVLVEPLEVEDAWEDLWGLFEVCRWLCARSDRWETRFGTTLKELLPVKERLSLQ